MLIRNAQTSMFPYGMTPAVWDVAGRRKGRRHLKEWLSGVLSGLKVRDP